MGGSWYKMEPRWPAWMSRRKLGRHAWRGDNTCLQTAVTCVFFAGTNNSRSVPGQFPISSRSVPGDSSHSGIVEQTAK